MKRLKIHKLKVHGKTILVDYYTLIMLAQKGMSAHQKWEKAAALRKSLLGTSK